MVVAALPIFGAAGFKIGTEVCKIASSAMVAGIKTLYGISKDINEYLDEHIEEMKRSENPTVSRTGRIFEMAKYGFGMGYITSVVVIAVGQLILGNALAAVTVVATAATLTNPIAMTCAAVGAIYYGWNALSDQEKNEMLEKLSHGLEIGIEMIRSVIRFLIDKTKEIWNSDNLAEIKKNISSAAAVFGKTLGDVTHKLVDKVSDGLDTIKSTTSKAMANTADLASDAYDVMKEKGGKAADLASDAYDSVKEHGEKAVERIKSKKNNDAVKVEQKVLGSDKSHLE